MKPMTGGLDAPLPPSVWALRLNVALSVASPGGECMLMENLVRRLGTGALYGFGLSHSHVPVGVAFGQLAEVRLNSPLVWEYCIG